MNLRYLPVFLIIMHKITWLLLNKISPDVYKDFIER